MENIDEIWRNENRSYELIRYGVGGVATTLISFLSYWLLLCVGLEYRIANLLSIILAKSFAYLINKLWVFRSQRSTKTALIKEIILFILTRGFSGIVEFLGLILLVDVFEAGRLFGKACMTVIVICLNYVFGKFIVYKKEG